jgi:hypothetical protein
MFVCFEDQEEDASGIYPCFTVSKVKSNTLFVKNK